MKLSSLLVAVALVLFMPNLYSSSRESVDSLWSRNVNDLKVLTLQLDPKYTNSEFAEYCRIISGDESVECQSGWQVLYRFIDLCRDSKFETAVNLYLDNRLEITTQLSLVLPSIVPIFQMQILYPLYRECLPSVEVCKNLAIDFQLNINMMKHCFLGSFYYPAGYDVEENLAIASSNIKRLSQNQKQISLDRPEESLGNIRWWIGNTWRTGQKLYYFNDRFEYKVSVPTRFTPQGEALNGDGQVFESTNGIKILTFGSWVVSPQFECKNVEAIHNITVNGKLKDGEKIVFETQSRDISTIVGAYTNGSCYYRREVFEHKEGCDKYPSFSKVYLIEYPCGLYSEARRIVEEHCFYFN